MTQKVRCQTRFDITATGVRSHYQQSRIPFTDATGKKIVDNATWHRARNQQRNWETLTQIISLRTLPYEITMPVMIEQDNVRTWEFTFEIDSAETILQNGNTVGALQADCVGVPMILGLDENSDIADVLVSTGPDTNIWFSLETGK
jgi:hypothetical protein